MSKEVKGSYTRPLKVDTDVSTFKYFRSLIELNVDQGLFKREETEEIRRTLEECHQQSGQYSEYIVVLGKDMSYNL